MPSIVTSSEDEPMWSRHRAEAAQRELRSLGTGISDVDEIHAAALSVIQTVVPYDAACVGAVDPDTLLLTSGVTVGFDPSAGESDRFTQIEYGALDRHSFSNLVDQGIAVAHSGEVVPSRRGGVRFNELTKLMGFSHDVRLTFIVDRTCWAVGDLYRSGGATDFDAREIEFLESATAVVARATREALLVRRSSVDPPPVGPAVVLVGRDGRVASMTGPASEWFARPDLSGADRLAMSVRSVVAVVFGGAPSAYSRVRIGNTWAVIRASALPRGTHDDDEMVAVTIDQAASPDLTDLLVEAHGLTRRERDVCLEVVAGRSTREIADRLFIGPNTVQDHLKSIFAKTGVSSRRELVVALGG